MNNIINTLYSSLGQEEVYDATRLNIWSFKKSCDIINGVQMKLSNMAGGFPFVFNKVTYSNNEVLYLSGEFSENTDICKRIQNEMREMKSGFAAKKFVKTKYKEYIREDFNEFRFDWMLYVVWQKCLGNVDFRNKLLSIPDDAILIEDTSSNNSNTSSVWGAKNKELTGKRKEIENYLVLNNDCKTKKALNELISLEINKVRNIGTFIGQNNMGKILMICQKCLKENITPPYNANLLNSKQIYINGQLIKF